MSNVPILGEKKMDNEPMFRLLYCLVCQTLEELPPYEGIPEQDHLLAIACENHSFESGEPHKGKLYVVPLRAWAKTESKKEIIRQIKGGGSKGLAEVDDKFYDSRSTFLEDAMQCYKQHNRPKEGCADWHSKDRLLIPNTIKERKAEGMANYKDEAGPKTYLCDFCPVAVGVAQRKRKLLGMD
ncbi:hypothetical protein UFOVP964_75 [uncultured Caudovirales phage]|uniref:Uncharacterized protein n=1 Tax=uncultured Caudovirales phage TaxID=2100421 RepID=A0A6J5R3E5_9CAUD|nr:hypothetical protein UFOVP854_75 [uncultured Caudovirales phage]CAB4174705.1 hypothetical protein UFOVP964_75 [uncultured Caudovirales phage]CAB4179366.1 hypothetical protein UFOVP1034_83 [uncultured Caudovirales phage]CAB4189127.1 hypothetical protein UFOVP1177_83 [uncultured Caudovirales phage]CAB4193389.1 hypothetical protein UFOVP1243_70 [uncultured Caudovirales phage]